MLKKQFEDPEYIESVKNAILDRWAPVEKKGRTLVSFKINKKGELGELKVLESSGDAGYDQHCLKAVEAGAAKFSEPPGDEEGERSAVELHFAFGGKKA